MPVDLDIRAILANRPAGAPRPGQVSVAELRRAMSAAPKPDASGVDFAEVRDLTVQGEPHALRMRLYLPKDPARFLMLYFHGGGFVLGDLDFADGAVRAYARRLGCAVVSVDYRLAPEHPFPSAVEDAWSALNWTAQNAEAWVGAKLPLIVCGDSAGGNLAAVVAILARDCGGPAIAGQLLLNPITRTDPHAEFEDIDAPVLGPSELAWFISQYVTTADDRRDFRASPSHAASLRDLPPAFVLTSEFDLLRTEAEHYAAQLCEAGVLTMAKRYLGGTHSFLPQFPDLPISRGALDDIDRFLSGLLRRSEL